jgi:hypothetical protein
MRWIGLGVTANKTNIATNTNDILTLKSTVETNNNNITARLATIEGADTVSGSVLNAIKVSKEYTDNKFTEYGANVITPITNRLDVIEGDEITENSMKYIAKQIFDSILGSATAETIATVAALSTAIENDPNIVETLKNHNVTQVANLKSELRDGVNEDLDTFKEIVDEINRVMDETGESISNGDEQTLNSAKTYTDTNGSGFIYNYTGVVSNGKVTFQLPLKNGNSFIYNKLYAFKTTDGKGETYFVDYELDVADVTGKTFKIIDSEGFSSEGATVVGPTVVSQGFVDLHTTV